MGRVLDALAIVRPPRREHGVADPRAVDMQLDQPSSGRVEHRAADPSLHCELAAQERRRPAALEHDVAGAFRLRLRHRHAGIVGVVARDPPRAPLAQSRPEAGRLAPRRRVARLVPDPHPPPAVARRRERAARVDDVHRGRRLDAAAVPQLRVLQRDDDLVGGLALRASRGLERPAEPRRRIVDTRHVAPMLTAQIDRTHRYPFTAPAVSPSTILRLKNMNMISGGIVISRMSANSRWYEVANWLWKLKSVSCTVAFSSPGRK